MVKDLILGTPSRSPAAMAAYHATVIPNGGVVEDWRTYLVPRIANIRRAWVARVIALFNAGWSVLQSPKLAYAQNCLPCICTSDPITQTCKLIPCPFCHARKVADIYMRAQKLIIKLGNVRVISWRRKHGRAAVDMIYLNEHGRVTGLGEVFAEHNGRRREIRRTQLQAAYGGAQMVTIAPHTFDHPSPEGACGRWLVQQSVLAVVPRYWRPPRGIRKRAVVRTNPDPHDLAYQVGRAFRYPQHWLTSDPCIMRDLLEAMKGRRFKEIFGDLRGSV